MNPWLLAARPKTLPAAIVPVWLGAVLGDHLGGPVRWDLAVAALLSTLALQIATNFFNDALDFRKGADTAARLGPVRVTASGLLPPHLVMLCGIFGLGLAGLFALPLLIARGWPILAIGLPSLYFCFGYTGGPWPLAYRGLGELFVLLFFGLVAVTGTVFVVTGQWWWGPSLLLGAQVGGLSTALIAINNLRDVAEDRTTGKRTLAVRFGESFARAEITVLLLLPFVLGLAWLPPARWLALGPLVLLPLAVILAGKIRRTPPSAAYNRFLALTGVLLLLFAVVFTVAIYAP